MSDSVLKGNINAAVTSGPFLDDRILRNLKVVNKTGGTVTMNLQINTGNGLFDIAPQNVQLTVGTAYEDDYIKIKAGETVFLSVNGSCDYYMDFEPATT